MRFLWEEDVDGLLLVWRVWCLVTDLDDVELYVSVCPRLRRVTHLGSSTGPCGEGEQLAVARRAIQSDAGEGRGVTLNRLRDTPFC